MSKSDDVAMSIWRRVIARSLVDSHLNRLLRTSEGLALLHPGVFTDMAVDELLIDTQDADDYLKSLLANTPKWLEDHVAFIRKCGIEEAARIAWERLLIWGCKSTLAEDFDQYVLAGFEE